MGGWGAVRTVLKMLGGGGSVLLLFLGLLALPFLQLSANAATVSDNFNRANGGLGSNWTTVSGTTAPQIVNNMAQPGSAGTLNSAYWSANTFGGNQYAAASFPGSSGTNYGPGIAVRLSNSTGYFLWYGNSASTVSIWRMDSSSSWTELKASANLTVAATDVWQLQAVGSTLTGYQNGKQVVTTTDTHYTTGAPGIWMYYATNQITNWSGGDVATTSAYSVGGTVSGLTGTVVLQDNGGDNVLGRRQRLLHVPDPACQRRCVRGDGGDPADGADVRGQRRHRDGRGGERHQRRGGMHDQPARGVFGRRDGVGADRDRGAAGQRRRQRLGRRQRLLHVPDPACQRRCVRGDGGDPADGPDVRGQRRHRDGRGGERHQRRGGMHDQPARGVFGRRDGVGADRDRGAAGQRRRQRLRSPPAAPSRSRPSLPAALRTR